MEFTDHSKRETYEAPSVDGCIITGAALLQMNNLRTSKTFGECCEIEISKKVEWKSCLTFTEKHQENEKHVKEGERTKG